MQHRKGDCAADEETDGEVGVEAEDEAHEEADSDDDDTEEEQDASVEVEGERRAAGVPVGGGHVNRSA